MSTAPLLFLTKVTHMPSHLTPTQQLFLAVPGTSGAVERFAPCWGRWAGIDGHTATRRWERRQHSIRAWPAVALCSSSTPTGEESEGPQPSRHNTDNLREDGDSFVCLDSGRNGDASSKDGAGRSGGRVASGASISGNLRLDLDDWPTKSTKVSRGSRNSMGEGRLRLKWGIDIDIQVPTVVEALVKGPWDPDGAIWGRQLDMALEVIQRSGGVVFHEQLLPILNPREGPSEYFEVNGRGGDSDTTTNAVNERIVRRLLYELEGVPEATSEGDILYVFRGLASTEKRQNSGLGASEDDWSEAIAEVLQFEEVSGFLEALPKMLNDKGPALATEFFQRTTLSGLALFLGTCLLLGQLFFGSWPLWLATGPGYLLWVGLDDTLKRSRKASAKQRDQFRGQWADACRGDSDAVWRKRAAARSRARRLSVDPMMDE